MTLDRSRFYATTLRSATAAAAAAIVLCDVFQEEDVFVATPPEEEDLHGCPNRSRRSGNLEQTRRQSRAAIRIRMRQANERFFPERHLHEAAAAWSCLHAHAERHDCLRTCTNTYAYVDVKQTRLYAALLNRPSTAIVLTVVTHARPQYFIRARLSAAMPRIGNTNG